MMGQFDWDPAQQGLMTDAINAEITNSRLADKVVDEMEPPLSPTARTVAKDKYVYADPRDSDAIDESHTNLIEGTQFFYLTEMQVLDADLAIARTRARRAAQLLARSHDAAVFKTAIRDEIYENQDVTGYHKISEIPRPFPDGVVRATADALAKLDDAGYRSSFVLVAGQGVYTELHTRAQGQADLPRTAVAGLIDGPIHRSNVLPREEALLISLSGSPIDRAVAVAPVLEHLRIADRPDPFAPPPAAGEREKRIVTWEFRLYERYLPRFRESLSVVLLRMAEARAPRSGGGS